MRRAWIAFLLSTAGAAQAALPRVALEVPLAPVGAPSFIAAPGAAAASGMTVLPTALSAAPASLSAAPLPLAAAPSAAAPAPAAALPLHAAPALSALPIPEAFAARPAAADGKVRAADALRAHAGEIERLAADLNSASAEDAAAAMSRSFSAAAALGPENPGAPSAAPGSPEARADLLNRLLQRVRIDDGGVPERGAALKKAFERMLLSPSARTFAERFIADGAPAVVRFEEVPGSRVYVVDGRRIFHAPRAFTEWRDGEVEVRMNLDYLGTDQAFQDQDLPPTLAHELLGHGLWYARAARENAYQAYHHHELNETNARLVGWLTDFELDGRLEESGAWSYIADPAGFLAYLKLRLPYYALTFSNDELMRPVAALKARLAAAKARRPAIERERANTASWVPLIKHFVKEHGIPESRFRALRQHLDDSDKSYAADLETLDALIAEVDATLGRMHAEPDQASERYLQWAATHPIFVDLARETAENTARLQEMVRLHPPLPDLEAARQAAEHWKGQITFDELVRMIEKDQRDHPHHWD